MSKASERPPMRRVVVASTAGSMLEFYDFIIYGTAAALVFPKVFFPALGETAGMIASFATVGVAFVARPLGGIIFGHYGDRIGRKKTLMITLMMMGFCTVLIGLLPTPATIGVAAPILLVLLRVVQGVAVGGEWAGAVLLATEYAPKERRGLAGAYPQMGGPLAFSLASATFLITTLTIGETDAAFLEYGWRIPFLLSIALIAVGLYARIKIDETPVFKDSMEQQDTPQGLPFVSVLREQWREVLVGALALVGTFCGFYLGTAYLTSYATGAAGPGLSRPAVLGMGVVAGLVYAGTTLAGGLVSDRIGRKRTILSGTIALAVVGLFLFPLINIGTMWSFGLALILTTAVLGFTWGPAGPLLSELFDTRHRYTGAGASYNLAAILGGAFTPILATALLGSWGSWSIGLMLSAFSLVSILGILKLPETRNRALTESTSTESTGDASDAPAAPVAVPVRRG